MKLRHYCIVVDFVTYCETKRSGFSDEQNRLNKLRLVNNDTRLMLRRKLNGTTTRWSPNRKLTIATASIFVCSPLHHGGLKIK